MFSVGGVSLNTTTDFGGRAVVVGVDPAGDVAELTGGDPVMRQLDRREAEELRDELTEILERW